MAFYFLAPREKLYDRRSVWRIIEILRWWNTIELILSRVFLLRVGKREFPARRLSQSSVLYRVYSFPRASSFLSLHSPFQPSPPVTSMYISRSLVAGKKTFSRLWRRYAWLFSSFRLRSTRTRPLNQPSWTLPSRVSYFACGTVIDFLVKMKWSNFPFDNKEEYEAVCSPKVRN